LWSGLLEAGVHELNSASKILILGGREGTAVTADVIVLESLSADAAKTAPVAHPQPSVNSQRNVEWLPSVPAKRLRFTILETNASQPCLDELEVWSGDKNVALASHGTVPTCSSALPGYEIHQLEHINDGEHGNSKSWISNEPTGGWVELEFPQPVTIDRIEWGRDRTGRYRDRVAIQYEISVAGRDGNWSTVASHRNRMPVATGKPETVQYDLTGLTDAELRQAQKWQNDLLAISQRLEALSNSRVAYLGKFQQPGPTHVLYRGEPTAKREQVAPDTVRSLGQLGIDESTAESERRTALARWITSGGRDLLARVLVNRLWLYHFGNGIVDTPSDFGRNASQPTHPKLLDWLASELIRSGWSVKHVQRCILMSATYRQSSKPHSQGLQIDGASRLLWRYPSRRLEAESIRDLILATSGVLRHEMYGPGFDGFKVELENVRHYFPKLNFGPADWRRMIYMTNVRQEQDSVFGAFDCPDGSQSVPKRSRSTTPLQALNLFNSRFSVQQSELMAASVVAAAGDEIDRQIELAFQLSLQRLPSDGERNDAQQLIIAFGLDALCRALLNSNEFLFLP